MKVPVLVTLDVHEVPRIGDFVVIAADELQALGIKATFLIPAVVLEANRAAGEHILETGHMIGSHGLLHNSEPSDGYPAERYDLLDEPSQRRFIEEATETFHRILGHQVTAFRSPCFGISGATVRLLEEFGYSCDLSVNSQRLDAFTADPFKLNQIRAPRLPYHPSRSDPFRRGDSEIWEIPLSAFVIPFAVMTLITFRERFTKFFFRMLLREARRTGKPIVFMIHPEEFSSQGSTYTIPLRELRARDFLPLKGSGIRARQALRMGNPAEIARISKSFLSYMGSFEDIEYVTADEYVTSRLCESSEAM